MKSAEADATVLLSQVRSMLDQGRLGAARPLLNAVLRLAPPNADSWDLEARLLLTEGRTAEALTLLDRAIAMRPDAASLWLTRAGARMRGGDNPGALADAAAAVLAEPARAFAKALLGILLWSDGRVREARACLAEAVAAEPGNGDFRQALAGVQDALGDTALACMTLDDGIARAPRHAGLRGSAVLLRMRHGDFAAANALAEAARDAGIADACVFGLMGHARASLGDHAGAAEAYAEARKLAPDDPQIRNLDAVGEHPGPGGRSGLDFVRTSFDGYATRFDAHLIALAYRIPGLMRAELAALLAAGEATGAVLDLGCGTGLVGVAASGLSAGPWSGVDVSPGMLAEARRRGLYADLHEAEIGDFLAADQQRYRFVLAADVLPYLADLTPTCRGVATRLAAGGHFIFSVEALPAGAPGWRLGRLGRHAHTADHVSAAAAAAGLVVAALRPECIRLELGQPVAGLFVRLRARDG